MENIDAVLSLIRDRAETEAILADLHGAHAERRSRRALHDARRAALEEIAAEIEAAIRRSDEKRSASEEANGGEDERTLFLSEIGCKTTARIVPTGAWKRTMDRFVEEHRDLLDAGDASWDFAKVLIPPGAVDTRVEGESGVDVRHVLVWTCDRAKSATLHNSASLLHRDVATTLAAHAAGIEAGICELTTGLVLVPPNRALS